MTTRHDGSNLATDDMVRLLADHADDPTAELPGWHRALEAFDALDADDLDEARAMNEALDADPLLIFRRLPAPEVDADELADMKRSVHELRRAKAIEAESAEIAAPVRRADRVSRWRRLGRSSGLRLAAALAGVALTAALLLPSWTTSPAQSPAESTAELARATARDTEPTTESEMLPLVENMSGEGTIIQIEDPGLSLVVVVAGDSLSDNPLSANSPSAGSLGDRL